MNGKIKYLAVFTVVIALTITGCKSNNSPVTPFGSTPSSNLLMKVHSYNPSYSGKDAVKFIKSGKATYVQFPTVGGTLDVSSALMNFQNLKIEENSGFDGQYQGNNNSGDQKEGGPEVESPDVTISGPFSVDMSSGTASIGSFNVYPGTFKKVDFQLVSNSADPYFGKTIVISGTYSANGGTAIPFALKSGVSSQLQLPLANGGISVTANSTVSINIIIDLPGLFNNLDFSSAKVANGEILIDAQNNSALLSAFENNLTKYVDAEKGNSSEKDGESPGK